MLRFCMRSNLSLFMASMLLGLAMTLYIIRTVHVISQDQPHSFIYNNRRLPCTEIMEDTLAIGRRREDNVTPCVCKGKDSWVDTTQQPLGKVCIIRWDLKVLIDNIVIHCKCLFKLVRKHFISLKSSFFCKFTCTCIAPVQYMYVRYMY